MKARNPGMGCGALQEVHEDVKSRERVSVIGPIVGKRGFGDAIGLRVGQSKQDRFWLWPGSRAISCGLMQRSLFGSGDTDSNNR